MNKTKRDTLIALLSALAIIINLIENWYIPPLSFGIRFGLANIISLVTIKLLGVKEMLFVVFIRLTLGNILKGTIFGTPFWISSMGLIFSTIAILINHKLNSSLIFTSMISAFFHTLGQTIVVSYLYNEISIMSLFPVLVVTSLATGILTAIISKEVLKRLKV